MIFKGYTCLVLLATLVNCHANDNLGELIDKVFGPSTSPPDTPYEPFPVDPGNNPDYVLNPTDPKQNGNSGDNYPDIKPIKENPSDNWGIGGDECTCVAYYLCNNNSFVTDGAGLIDIRLNGGACQESVDVCCGNGNTLKPDNPPPTPKPLGRAGCGRRNTDGVGFRITGAVDNEAQFGEFPWMVAILKEEEVNGDKLSIYKCGGALIHENVVLTAAHCVAKDAPHSLKARAGEWDTQTSHELLPHQDRYVSQVIIHEHYYAGALFNDIALLIMAEPFVFADNVDIVCLPRHDDVVLEDSCWASGWGKDVFGKEGSYQVILKRVELPMVPRDSCQTSLRHTRLGPKFSLHESFVCAGGIKGRDTCKGDGGSPLVCPIKGKKFQYQQVGMVAWGIGCGTETPAVYVNVGKFRYWIDNHLARFNYKTEYNY